MKTRCTKCDGSGETQPNINCDKCHGTGINQYNEKYTLEEAYHEILRIKNEMGFQEYQSREQQRAYEHGYQQAVIDLNTEFRKRSDILMAINTTRHEP